MSDFNPSVGSIQQTTAFRAALAAFNGAAGTMAATDIDYGLRALIGANQGAHPAAITQLWTAVAQAAANNAAGARTTISAAVTTAASDPPQNPGNRL